MMMMMMMMMMFWMHPKAVEATRNIPNTERRRPFLAVGGVGGVSMKDPGRRPSHRPSSSCRSRLSRRQSRVSSSLFRYTVWWCVFESFDILHVKERVFRHHGE